MVEFSIKKYVCEDFKVDYIQRPALFSWDPYDDWADPAEEEKVEVYWEKTKTLMTNMDFIKQINSFMEIF